MKENPDGLMFLTAMARRGDSLYDDMLPKALASFMFREIIEDAHAKYGISQEDMKQMNKTAANRAKLFFDEISGDKYMEIAFAGEAIMCNGWDKPEITEEEEKRLALYRESANSIRKIESENKSKKS